MMLHIQQTWLTLISIQSCLLSISALSMQWQLQTTKMDMKEYSFVDGLLM
nr:MAG TPA: hypothetical protein [Caudoviricetes sp.]